jgi:2-oxoglutarate/2-oxoacid ferredoxin oxidoreductase subunit alpha
VPEVNLGQLAMLLRARYLVDVESFNRVRGLPLQSRELVEIMEKMATT